MRSSFLLAALSAAVLAVPGLAQPNPQFPRGAKPTPPEIKARSTHFNPRLIAAPPQSAMIPEQLSMWGNSQYGDCVTAERAAAFGAWSKFCGTPIFVPEAEVIRWARAHNVLNGAYAEQVLTYLKTDGFQVSGKTYKGGPFAYVNYKDPGTLKQALTTGPVTIAIDADALSSGAGNASGWYSFGAKGRHNTDHEVGLLGYGPAKWCCDQIGVSLPAGVAADKDVYLLYTWKTIGLVDQAWLNDTCVEGWVSTPTIAGMTPGAVNPTAKLTADPLTVTPGDFTKGSSKLTWETTGAVAVTLDGQPVVASGSVMVTPTQTTAYTLTATGAAGTTPATATATVTVGVPPPADGKVVVDPAAKTVTVPAGWTVIGGGPAAFDATTLTAAIRAGKVDPLVILMDGLAIYTAYKSGDYVAVAAAVAKLIADLQQKAPAPATTSPLKTAPKFPAGSAGYSSITYTELLRRVHRGGSVTVSVGEQYRAYYAFHLTDAPAGMGDGVWRCFLRAGVASMERLVTAPVRAARAVANTVRDGGAHWTHPGNTREGLIQHLLSHPNHASRHTFASLQAMSYEQLEALHDADHNGTVQPLAPAAQPIPTAVQQTAPVYQLAPATAGGCPNGQCPTSTAPARRGLFGWR